MPTVRVNGIDLYYEVAGSGPPVLFVSGTGGDLRQRPRVFDGPLAQHCTVLAYDQRGLGRSSKPDRRSSMADYAADAAGLVDAVGWQHTAVVGVSFGGMVAQEVAIRHAGLVERLVLCCTSSGGAGGSSYPLHELADLGEADRRSQTLALSDTRYGQAWQRDNPDEAEAMFQFMRDREAAGAADPGAATGARRQLETRRDHDTWGRLDRIRAPTLICAGRYDAVAPTGNSEALASRVRDARLEIFEGGHLFLIQDAAAWSVIIDFLVPSSPPSEGPYRPD